MVVAICPGKVIAVNLQNQFFLSSLPMIVALSNS